MAKEAEQLSCKLLLSNRCKWTKWWISNPWWVKVKCKECLRCKWCNSLCKVTPLKWWHKCSWTNSRCRAWTWLLEWLEVTVFRQSLKSSGGKSIEIPTENTCKSLDKASPLKNLFMLNRNSNCLLSFYSKVAPQNIMYDRRVVRGNTFAALVIPVNMQPDPALIEK